MLRQKPLIALSENEQIKALCQHIIDLLRQNILQANFGAISTNKVNALSIIVSLKHSIGNLFITMPTIEQHDIKKIVQDQILNHLIQIEHFLTYDQFAQAIYSANQLLKNAPNLLDQITASLPANANSQSHAVITRQLTVSQSSQPLRHPESYLCPRSFSPVVIWPHSDEFLTAKNNILAEQKATTAVPNQPSVAAPSANNSSIAARFILWELSRPPNPATPYLQAAATTISPSATQQHPPVRTTVSAHMPPPASSNQMHGPRQS